MLTGKTGLVFENETNTVADPGGGESRSILTSEYIEIFKIPRDFSENLVPLLQKSAPPPSRTNKTLEGQKQIQYEHKNRKGPFK